MSAIEPLPAAAITDPELRELMARAARLGVPDERFTLLLAHAPGYAKPALRALLIAHEEGAVDHKLKEIIRLLLARFARDPYFAGLRSTQAQAAGLDEATIKAGCDDYMRDPRFSPAERIALRFADQMYLDARAIDAAFYDELKRYYSEAQIMELGAFIANHYSMQKFMAAITRLNSPPPPA